MNRNNVLTSIFNGITDFVAHGCHDTGGTGAVDATTEWQEEATLSTPPQVIPQPTGRTRATTGDTHHVHVRPLCCALFRTENVFYNLYVQ